MRRPAAALVLAACAAAPHVSVAVPHVPAPRVTAYVNTCDDGARFSVRYDAPTDGTVRALTLRLVGTSGDRVLRLGIAASGSGGRYVGQDSLGTVTFWEHQGEATLTGTGLPNRTCRPEAAASPWDEARLLGAEYRAVGQEPGWTVEVDEEHRIQFVGDYGNTRVATPAPPPVTEMAAAGANRVTYTARTAAHALVVEVVRQTCRDDMSGERFPTTAVVRLDGREYRGCGRWLGATPRR